MKKSKFKISITIIILAFVVLLLSNAKKDKNWVSDYSENEDIKTYSLLVTCLLYTSDAADDLTTV